MLDSITTVVFDLDGTLYYGDFPVRNAAYTVNQLRKIGLQILFLTNNSVKTRKQIRNKLQRMEIQCTENEIITSGYTAALYAKYNNLTDIYICGSEGLREEFENAGFTACSSKDAKNLVIGYDPDFSYTKLSEAFSAALNAEHIIACNKERSFPGNDNTLLPGCAAMVAPIEYCANRPADVVIGKPQTRMLELICREHTVAPNQILVVGDTYESDILMAQKFGCQSAYFNGNHDKTKYPADIHLDELSRLCTYFHD